MKVTVQEASIKTVGIEVKALTISAKQVTLAVFRQLDKATLLDTATATLNGEPWGRVNYHPDKCADGREHLHIIWQHGDQLRRANVERRPPQNAYFHERWAELENLAHELALAKIRDGEELISEERREDDPHSYNFYGYSGETVSYKGYFFFLRHDFDFDNGDNEIKDAIRLIRDGEDGSVSSTKVKERLAKIDKNAIKKEMNMVIDEWQRFGRKWTARYLELASLDLLFIAV